MWFLSVAAQHSVAALCIAVCIYLYMQILVMQDDIRSLIVCYRDLFVQTHHTPTANKKEHRDTGLDHKHCGGAGGTGGVPVNTATSSSSSSGTPCSTQPKTTKIDILMQQMFDSANPQQFKKKR